MDDVDFDGLRKLTSGLSIRDLVEKGSLEFEIEPDDLWVHTKEDTSVESTYDYEDCKKHIKLECIQCGPDDTQSTRMPFEVISSKMTNVDPDGKVKKQILRSGSTKIPAEAIVFLHYNKYLEMEEIPFDSTYLRNEAPIRLHIGSSNQYPGFEIAVSSMCVGEMSQFLIHPDLAFGKLGAPPRIPPAATILVVIEVFKALEYGTVTEEEPVSLADRKVFKTAYTLAKNAHTQANGCFGSRNVLGAVELYRKAESYLLNGLLTNDEEEQKMKYLLLKIYINMTVCYNTDSLKAPEKVCIAARRALELDPDNAQKSAKLFYNRGLAHLALGNHELASKDLIKAQKLEPTNMTINQAIKKMEESRKMYQDIEKRACKKMFGFSKSEEQRKFDTFGIDDDCRNTVMEILENFLKGKASSLMLGSGFTIGERSFLKQEAERLGLKYYDTFVAAGKRDVTISKVERPMGNADLGPDIEYTCHFNNVAVGYDVNYRLPNEISSWNLALFRDLSSMVLFSDALSLGPKDLRESW